MVAERMPEAVVGCCSIGDDARGMKSRLKKESSGIPCCFFCCRKQRSERKAKVGCFDHRQTDLAETM